MSFEQKSFEQKSFKQKSFEQKSFEQILQWCQNRVKIADQMGS